MKIIVKDVQELTSEEYRACYVANYRDWGYMQPTLSTFRSDKRGGIAILLWDETKVGNRALIGWALMTPVTTRGLLAATEYTKRKSRYTVQFWVKSHHRKKGHGKTLMAEVKKIDPRPHVLPHDSASAEFFSSWDVTVLSTDRVWIKRKNKVA